MWNIISVHLDCLVIGLHVCGIGRYFQIWWKIKNGIIFLELRFWYGTLEFFQLPFPLTPNTLGSGSNRHSHGWAWHFWDFGLGYGQTIVPRVRETLLCTLLIWLSCWVRKTFNQVSKVQISFTHRGRNQSVRGWPWKSRPFEVSWRSFVFIRLLIRISSFC